MPRRRRRTTATCYSPATVERWRHRPPPLAARAPLRRRDDALARHRARTEFLMGAPRPAPLVDAILYDLRVLAWYPGV